MTGHPPEKVLRKCLASLDTSTAGVVAHLLECTRCAAGAQASLSLQDPSGSLETLSFEELETLERLLGDQRKLLTRWRRFASRVGRAAPLSVRGEVRDRLLCVLHDLAAPAVRDLEAIDSIARGEGDVR